MPSTRLHVRFSHPRVWFWQLEQEMNQIEPGLQWLKANALWVDHLPTHLYHEIALKIPSPSFRSSEVATFFTVGGWIWGNKQTNNNVFTVTSFWFFLSVDSGNFLNEVLDSFSCITAKSFKSHRVAVVITLATQTLFTWQQQLDADKKQSHCSCRTCTTLDCKGSAIFYSALGHWNIFRQRYQLLYMLRCRVW